jgi:hypothetical protein
VLAGHTATIEDAGGGFYTCTIKSAAGTYTYFQVGISDADNSLVSTAHASNGVLLWHPQMELGATATSYQSITTASTYNTSGFPLMRRHDGIDDGTATAAFAAGTLTSNMDFFCVVRRESAAKFILCQNAPPGGTAFFACGDPAGGVSVAHSNAGASVAYNVNGVDVAGGTATTRVQLDAAIPVGSLCVLQVKGLDLSLWTGLGLSTYAAYFLNGSLGDIILCPAQTDAVRAKIRRKLAAQYSIAVV